jgi:hypothetical protein
MINDWRVPAGLGRDMFGRALLAGLLVLALFLPPLLLFLMIAVTLAALLPAAAGRARFAVWAVVPSPARRLAPRAPPSR